MSPGDMYYQFHKISPLAELINAIEDVCDKIVMKMIAMAIVQMIR